MRLGNRHGRAADFVTTGVLGTTATAGLSCPDCLMPTDQLSGLSEDTPLRIGGHYA